jgi:hypothetical protein
MSAAQDSYRRFKDRVSAYCTAALLVALTGLALCASVSAAFSDGGAPGTHVTVTVPVGETTDPHAADFNDGFRDAKADDCEQGFKAACDWLRDNAK